MSSNVTGAGAAAADIKKILNVRQKLGTSLTLTLSLTVGPLRIGDDVITKDSLFVIIAEIDTRIYKTYLKLDYTSTPQLSER